MSEQILYRCYTCPHGLGSNEEAVDPGELPKICLGTTHILTDPLEVTTIQGDKAYRAPSADSGTFDIYCGKDDVLPTVGDQEKLILGPHSQGVRYGMIVRLVAEIGENDVDDMVADYWERRDRLPTEKGSKLQLVPPPAAPENKEATAIAPGQLWVEMEAAMQDTTILDAISFALDASETGLSILINSIGGSQDMEFISARIAFITEKLRSMQQLDAFFKSHLSSYLQTGTRPEGELQPSGYSQLKDALGKIKESHVFEVPGLGEANQAVRLAAEHFSAIAAHTYDIALMSNRRSLWITETSSGSNNSDIESAASVSQDCKKEADEVSKALHWLSRALGSLRW